MLPWQSPEAVTEPQGAPVVPVVELVLPVAELPALVVPPLEALLVLLPVVPLDPALPLEPPDVLPAVTVALDPAAPEKVIPPTEAVLEVLLAPLLPPTATPRPVPTAPTVDRAAVVPVLEVLDVDMAPVVWAVAPVELAVVPVEGPEALLLEGPEAFELAALLPLAGLPVVEVLAPLEPEDAVTPPEDPAAAGPAKVKPVVVPAVELPDPDPEHPAAAIATAKTMTLFMESLGKHPPPHVRGTAHGHYHTRSLKNIEPDRTGCDRARG